MHQFAKSFRFAGRVMTRASSGTDVALSKAQVGKESRVGRQLNVIRIVRSAGTVLILSLAGCATSAPVQSTGSSASVIPPTVFALERSFVRATILEVPLLSPRRFERARSHFEEGRRLSPSDGERELALLNARSELKAANEAAALSRQLLAEPLEARASVLRHIEKEGQKNTAMRRAFNRAERAFRELTEMVEEDQLRRALQEKSAVVRAYLDCEAFLTPLPSFAEAQRILERARLVGAARRFPEEFLSTKQTLAAAEKFAREHPRAYNETPRRIREADFYARRMLAKARFPEASSIAE